MKYLIRHTRSRANKRGPAFGDPAASITGIYECRRQLRPELQRLGVDFDQSAATGTLRRHRQSAWLSGFSKDNLVVNPLLDEVELPPDLDRKTVALLAVRKIVLPGAIAQATLLLENPPPQEVAYSSGLTIQAVRFMLDMEPEVPHYNEITEIPVPDGPNPSLVDYIKLMR